MNFTTPHYMARSTMRASIKDALSGKYSYSRERLPWVWQNFQREEEIGWVFAHFKEQALVDVFESPDDCDADDLFGDMFDEGHAGTIPGGMRELRAQKKQAEERLRHQGQWYHEAVFRDPGEDGWHTADSVGGFVGDDFYGSGYEPDLYLAALEGLFDSRGGKLPEYVPSKDGAWSKAVLMGWEMIKGDSNDE